jgi:ABC-type multidrug transport system fused ATPase/permease subunit
MDTTRGNILIDGTNIKLLGLQELRSSISVISQTPALIEGTLRQNLDIRNEFSDLKLWNVLTAVQLKSRVAKGLQTRVIISKYPRITPVA